MRELRGAIGAQFSAAGEPIGRQFAPDNTEQFQQALGDRKRAKQAAVAEARLWPAPRHDQVVLSITRGAQQGEHADARPRPRKLQELLLQPGAPAG